MPKVILISGGSDGLGKAMAKKLSPNNQVVILAHNKSKLEATAKELNCDFVEADVADYSTLKTAVDEVIKKYHQIDVLINNAGVWIEGELDSNDPEKIKELIEINTTGTILLTQAVLGDMRAKKSGQIVNIVSQAGLYAKKGRSVYNASKWAITGFTKCLQEDLDLESIKVTAINPGKIKTKLFEKSGINKDLSDAIEPDKIAEVVEFVINLDPGVHIPEIGIKNKVTQTPNMDNTSSPTIDLNIDPNMIAAQDDSPQADMPTQPVTPVMPVKNPGVIDITPGSTDTFPAYTPVSNHIDTAPVPEPKITDITPSAPALDSLSHLSDLNPEPVGEPIPDEPVELIETTPEPTIEPVKETTPEPVATAPTFAPVIETPVTQNPVAQATPQTAPAVSPIAEDPDLVKLIK